MYDLHTHTTFSDGDLIPAELIRRAAVCGYQILAICDHVDWTNIDIIIQSIPKMRSTAKEHGITLLAGVELTHTLPADIGNMAQYAKEQGADIVIVHGETTVEPVLPGTNAAACSCPYVDVLAHPGFITHFDAKSAMHHDIWLELTARGGHNRTNGHVARIAEDTGATLVVNSDSHAPHDLMDGKTRENVVFGSGISHSAAKEILNRDLSKFL
ncbi:MAG: histidinol phosphate phosphatase domain-containing protein [Methanomicrobiales archaeon]|jgi:histidinol phosphatase-like PHP family hydrolase|nr:histidinol phosphate phosphatase domain-containing protein [Methanomicrobiales archaeon]